MGELVLAAKITHVPSLMLSEQLEPLKGTRDGPINSLKLIGQAGARARRRHLRGVRHPLDFEFRLPHQRQFLASRHLYQPGSAAHDQRRDLRFPGNPELADLIAAETAKDGPLALAHRVTTMPVEYGTIVPMHYMNGDKAMSVVPIASPVFASVDENRRFGAAVHRAIATLETQGRDPRERFAVASVVRKFQARPGSLEQDFKRVQPADGSACTRICGASGRFAEFCAMLPDYTRKCSGEALMVDTVMLFGALGWDRYDGKAEQLCDYFPSSGSGQVAVEFHLS